MAACPFTPSLVIGRRSITNHLRPTSFTSVARRSEMRALLPGPSQEADYGQTEGLIRAPIRSLQLRLRSVGRRYCMTVFIPSIAHHRESLNIAGFLAGRRTRCHTEHAAPQARRCRIIRARSASHCASARAVTASRCQRLWDVSGGDKIHQHQEVVMSDPRISCNRERLLCRFTCTIEGATFEPGMWGLPTAPSVRQRSP
jgi:hypothetical protein